MKLSQALTWDEVAECYGSGARIRQIDSVFDALKSDTKNYYVDPVEGTIHKILKEEIK